MFDQGGGDDDDDISFYVQSNPSTMLKSVCGLNSYRHSADQQIRTNREPSSGLEERRVRRPSIVIREHQLSSYPINYDPSPEIIHKKVNEQHRPLIYKQDIAVRYLCPPTPPPPAPLIIREIRAPQPAPLPPIIIRQRPPAPRTPPPIIIRERPPTPPSYGTPKVIIKHVSAAPQAARRVIIERLPALPAKPPDIIVERWLPYREQKRQVIYEKALSTASSSSMIADDSKSKNVIIHYANPSVRIEKQMKSLGISRCQPFEEERAAASSSSSNRSSSQQSDPIYHNYPTLRATDPPHHE